ncbi:MULTISPECIES: GDSL-type esterase/lipase family protein [Flavobacteriaceae]|uniref:Sialate O-acetylesterase n=2 Tax=Flavobacteriaceae TaxID=49546 RepID=A0A4Y8AU63_9FLAO|nr:MULTISPECIES: GDSL-type esterase/lipase family protein [Flavobacteriaceae]TEW75023.1 sialate O-acetylesterase [Gramella jeungdoensis]GGK42190.1 sialate O-acetylesterase [Lutibacter litoralis]
MKKYILLLVVFCLTINSYSQKKYSEHYYKRYELFKSEADTKNEIVFLGNSITEGGDWKALFPNINAVNRGISGDVTDGILNRLDEVLSSQPKKIFILIGTNDLARGKSIDEVLNNSKILLEKIKAVSKETKIYLQSVLPYNPNIGTKFSGHKSKQQDVLVLNKKLKKLARDQGVKFLNIHKKFRNKKGELKANLTYDGLHLNKSGYVFWAKIIKKHVN